MNFKALSLVTLTLLAGASSIQAVFPRQSTQPMYSSLAALEATIDQLKAEAQNIPTHKRFDRVVPAFEEELNRISTAAQQMNVDALQSLTTPENGQDPRIYELVKSSTLASSPIIQALLHKLLHADIPAVIKELSRTKSFSVRK